MSISAAPMKAVHDTCPEPRPAGRDDHQADSGQENDLHALRGYEHELDHDGHGYENDRDRDPPNEGLDPGSFESDPGRTGGEWQLAM